MRITRALIGSIFRTIILVTWIRLNSNLAIFSSETCCARAFVFGHRACAGAIVSTRIFGLAVVLNSCTILTYVSILKNQKTLNTRCKILKIRQWVFYITCALERSWQIDTFTMIWAPRFSRFGVARCTLIYVFLTVRSGPSFGACAFISYGGRFDIRII